MSRDFDEMGNWFARSCNHEGWTKWVLEMDGLEFTEFTVLLFILKKN